MIVDADAKHLHLITDLADLADIIHKPVREFADVAQSITARQDFNKRTKVFHAADRTVVDFSNLNSRCASFDFFQRLLSHLCVRTGNGDFTVFFDLDDRFSFFLNRADIFTTRADQHPDLVSRNLGRKQTRSIGRNLFAWLSNGRQHRLQDFTTSFVGLVQGLTDDLAVDTADFEIQLDTGNSVLRSRNFEVHIAEVIFATQNIGNQSVVIAFLDHTHGDTRNRVFDLYAGRHQTQSRTANGRH